VNAGNFRNHSGWTGQSAGPRPRLRRREQAHGGAHSYRDHQSGVAPRRRSDAAQGGRVEVVSRREVMQSGHWVSAFGLEAKDHRYYELIEDTIHDEFDYRYFVVRDAAGEIRAVQPCFVLDQDLLVGTKPGIGRLTDLIRRVWPRFMRARMLMVGCAAGEGHVDGDNEAGQRANAQLLASSILDEARKLKTRLIVLKEFPAKYRSLLECFVDADFTRIPSLPNVLLNIDYENFEGYMTTALSGGARRKLRLKLKASENAPKIELSVVRDIAPIIDDVYPLYLAVYNRSSLHFEKLTKEYFCGLGQRMGDKNRFFIWRQGDRIVAFGSCLLQGDTMHAEYLGLDYSVAIDLHLYHYTFRDLVSWGIANGYKWFHSSALNYDPKLHLRYKLDPIDLYVRHTSSICNAVFACILPWLEPTRYDKTLKQFANYHELWAPTEGKKQPWGANWVAKWGPKAFGGLAPVRSAMSALKARSQRLLSTITLGG
jgi:Acetyltransferase (GNAT) domain